MTPPDVDMDFGVGSLTASLRALRTTGFESGIEHGAAGVQIGTECGREQ